MSKVERERGGGMREERKTFAEFFQTVKTAITM